MNEHPSEVTQNRWPYRLAVLLAMVTFPLIWVGGLVTTYDAGMAVPDWPGTYGYNLFLYPWQTWISGPWDLFIEHGHRLLGALAGLITIGLLAAVVRWDPRRRVWYYATGLLVAVSLQGTLGGFRVLLDDRQLAMLHGCFGPAFFALCVAMVVMTSRLWTDPTARVTCGRAANLHRLTYLAVGLSYGQLVLGAMMRHVSPMASSWFFRWTVFLHLIVAGLLLVLAGVLLVFARKQLGRRSALRWPVICMAGIISIQILLGCGTWVVNYYYPGWVPDWEVTAVYNIIQAKGLLQMTVVTSHQAMGTLVLGTTTWLMVRAYRVVRCAGKGAVA